MTRRTLFIGNSYTFYNDVPAQVVALAAEAGHALAVETVAEGGADVQLHWEKTGARQRIADGGFDTLVLQDQSGGPLHDRPRFDEYAPLLARAGIAAGARIVWYQTWARAAAHAAYRDAWTGGNPREMTRRVRDAYRAIAKTSGGIVAPAGDAWLLALEADPDLVLHDEDLHHAGPAGSHLSALVLAGTIAGVTPLAARYLPEGVDEKVAIRLRVAADRALASPGT